MNISNREGSTAVHIYIYIVVIVPNFKGQILPKPYVENK
jgi:hypothetical protein